MVGRLSKAASTSEPAGSGPGLAVRHWRQCWTRPIPACSALPIGRRAATAAGTLMGLKYKAWCALVPLPSPMHTLPPPPQVWHAVLGYISGFEEQLWELEDDPAAAQRVKAAVAAYKGARRGHYICLAIKSMGAKQDMMLRQ